jgi:hypothetical protein
LALGSDKLKPNLIVVVLTCIIRMLTHQRIYNYQLPKQHRYNSYQLANY